MASSLLGIWLAMGVNLGLFALAFYLIPGLSSFHDPARFLLWTSFGFATLAALGLERFFRAANPGNWLLKAGVILTILIPLIWFGGEWNPTTPPQSLIGSLTQRKELQELAENGRFESVGYNLLWKRFVDYGYNDFKTEESGFQLKQMQDSLLSNQEMNSQLETSTGYEPVPIVSTLEMTGLSRRAQLRNEPNYSRLLSMMNVSVILQAQPSQIADARIELVRSDERENSLKRKTLRLSLNRDRLPRAWLVRKTRNVLGKTRLAAALAAPDFQPEREAIVSTEQGDEGVALEWGSVDFKNVPVKPVAWEILSPTLIRLMADADKAPAFLVYSMALIPGWRGSLDGKPVRLLRANGGVLGMLIPTGKHTIILEYRPNAFLLGAYLSLCGLGGLVFWCAWLIADKFVRQNTSSKIVETCAAYQETEPQ